MGLLHLDFYSVWPVFACTALLLALAATPAFRAADSPPADQPRRIRTLDGLRGFLAIAVFFHHVALIHAESLTKVWRLTPSAFFNSLGPTGVAFFFMITGFLFWSRLIRSAERPAWPSFYLNRIFRIGPLFLFAAGLAMLAATYKAGFPHGLQALQRLGSWLFLGVLPFQDGGWLVGVTWSIQYEWFFYLSLPLLAFFARRRVHLPFVLTALALCTLGEILCSAGRLGHPDPAALLGLALPLTYVTLFLLGMLSATLTRLNVIGRLPDPLASLAVLLCAVTFFVLKDPAQLPKQILLGATFYLIASGCTLFGPLYQPSRHPPGRYQLRHLPPPGPGPLRRLPSQDHAHHRACLTVAPLGAHSGQHGSAGGAGHVGSRPD